MKSTRNAFVEKAKQSTFVPKWGLSTRPTHPLVDGETPGPSERAETVTTKSVISVSPLPDSQVKIEWAEGTKTESVIAASCSISSQGDVLTITYKCPPSDTLNTKKANEFFHSLNLTRITNHSGLTKSSSDQIVTSTKPKDNQKHVQSSVVKLRNSQNVETHEVVNSQLNLDKKENNSYSLKSLSGEDSEGSQANYSQENPAHSDVRIREDQGLATHEVVNRGITSKALSCVELNQTERVSIERSASMEEARLKVTTSKHSSSKDVDGEQKSGREECSSGRSSLDKELHQKISSEETGQEKCLPANVGLTTNDGKTKRKMAVKRCLSSPTEGPKEKSLKVTHRYSESSAGQTDNCLPTSSGNRQGDAFERSTKQHAKSINKEPATKTSKSSRCLPERFVTQTDAHPQTSDDEFFTPSSGSSSTYHSTCTEVNMEQSGMTDTTDLYQEADVEQRDPISSSSAPPTLGDLTSTDIAGVQTTNDMETSDGPKIFPNRMTMRSYQNVSGKDVWELSLNFD